jgi:hypothetical protein
VTRPRGPAVVLPDLQERVELVAEIALREEAVRPRGEGLVARGGARVEGDDHDERRRALGP